MIIPSASNIFDFDWYGRKGTLVNGETSYSSFVVDDKNARKLAGSNPLENPVKLSWFLTRFSNIVSKNNAYVYINEKSDESYTDGERIMVSSLSGWEKPSDTAYCRLDTYIGLSLHEACHCRYSDFNALKSANMTQTEQWISNVIEDEAIENTMRNLRPGYGKFFDLVKATQLGLENFDVVNDESKAQTVLNILFAAIRVPNFIGSALSEEQKKEFGYLFFEIYNVMRESGCIIKQGDKHGGECSTRKNIEAAKKIVCLIKDFCKVSDSEMDERKKQKSSANDPSESGGEEERKQKEEEMQRTLDELEEELGEGLSAMMAAETGEEEEMNVVFQNMECANWSGGAKGGVSDSVRFKKYKSNIYPYINKVINTLTVKSTKLNYKTERYSLTGSLDGSCIANAFAGGKFTNKRITEKKEREVKKLAVVLLSDISGSMKTAGAADKAGMLVTLLAEAVSQMSGYELYVYTHNDTVTEICNTSSYNKNKYNIGSIAAANAMGGQSEVKSYREAVEMTRKKTNLPICMINFTDSEYCSSPEKIAELVSNLKKKDCQTSLVCVNERNRNVWNTLIYGDDNYININSINPVAMQNAINKLTKIIGKMYSK